MASTTTGSIPSKGGIWSTLGGYSSPFSTGITVTQSLFNGFRTSNRTREAETQVLAARASLRNAEPTVLLDAVTAYMNLLRDTAIVRLRKSSVVFLQEQLRMTYDRFKVGLVMRADMAQAESRLAAGRSQLLNAESNYKSSTAVHRQVIGVNLGKLAPGSPVGRLSPRTLGASVAVGIATNSSVAAAEYNVDVARLAVKVAEGALLPSVSVQGSYAKMWLSNSNLGTLSGYNASALGTLSVPIYQGGSEYSLVRQAKETLAEKRLDITNARGTVRGNVVRSRGRLEAAKSNILATQQQVWGFDFVWLQIREKVAISILGRL